MYVAHGFCTFPHFPHFLMKKHVLCAVLKIVHRFVQNSTLFKALMYR